MEARWGEIDDHAVLRPHEAGVHQGPLDAVRAFLDGGLGQADQHGFGQSAVGDVDLDLGEASIPTSEKVRSLASIDGAAPELCARSVYIKPRNGRSSAPANAWPHASDDRLIDARAAFFAPSFSAWPGHATAEAAINRRCRDSRRDHVRVRASGSQGNVKLGALSIVHTSNIA